MAYQPIDSIALQNLVREKTTQHKARCGAKLVPSLGPWLQGSLKKSTKTAEDGSNLQRLFAHKRQGGWDNSNRPSRNRCTANSTPHKGCFLFPLRVRRDERNKIKKHPRTKQPPFFRCVRSACSGLGLRGSHKYNSIVLGLRA